MISQTTDIVVGQIWGTPQHRSKRGYEPMLNIRTLAASAAMVLLPSPPRQPMLAITVATS